MDPRIQPAHYYAQQFGVKGLLFGDPGIGKTPLFNTAPNPLLCAVEPGLLSMRNSQVPTWYCPTLPEFDQFWDWLVRSPDANSFHTIGMDSVTQYAELVIEDQLKKNKDPRKAYGEMSRIVMEKLNTLYFMRNKHVILIAKQAKEDENGTMRRRPKFPGQDVGEKTTHLFDLILHYGVYTVPGVVAPVKALRTAASYDVMARDRSGKLAEYEQPNLTLLFNKIMQG